MLHIDETLLESLFLPITSFQRWIVAYSGGCDSAVLLDLARRANAQFGRSSAQLRAVHVDHQLSDASASWADHCRAICQCYGIPFVLEKVSVSNTGRGVEDAARQARYAVFEAQLSADSVILLAHHLDDQLETLLLRLCRGTGIKGMAGMPRERRLGSGKLFRPLLDMSRENIVAYANVHDLSYINDPSNDDTQFDRNYLRKQVLPLLKQRWPAIDSAWPRFAQHCAEADKLLHTIGAEDFAALFSRDVAGDLYADIDALRQLGEPRLRNVLRFLTEQLGVSFDALTLSEVLEWIVDAQTERQRYDTSTLSFRRFRGALYCLPMAAGVSKEAAQQERLSNDDISAPGVWPLASGDCLQVDILSDAACSDAGLRPGRYRIEVREEGALCRVNGCTRPVKKLLHEMGVPPWRRQTVPILIDLNNGEVAAIADRWICDNARAIQGERWLLSWRQGQGEQTCCD